MSKYTFDDVVFCVEEAAGDDLAVLVCVDKARWIQSTIRWDHELMCWIAPGLGAMHHLERAVDAIASRLAKKYRDEHQREEAAILVAAGEVANLLRKLDGD